LVQPQDQERGGVRPSTEEEAIVMLGGDPNCGAFIGEYERWRESGMTVEHAMIFVGHHLWLRHLKHQAPGRAR
jgi:hypothetical protein